MIIKVLLTLIIFFIFAAVPLRLLFKNFYALSKWTKFWVIKIQFLTKAVFFSYKNNKKTVIL